ncbi:hypothetical protein AMTRI_Chr07g28920 [Amborella trichopoda]
MALSMPFLSLLLLLSLLLFGDAKKYGQYRGGKWKHAHATFYGGNDGSGTMGGACGYGDLNQQGYGLQTAALSSAMFNDGLKCGSCYEIRCTGEAKWCLGRRRSIVVTATNLCPPNWDQPSDNGGWCNPPRHHFDLAMPAFLTLAKYEAGIVPVAYRRVPCKKKGGMRFTITGHQYFNLVLVWNVGGAGDIVRMRVKGKKMGWVDMKRNWGQNWQSDIDLTGQSLSFRVTTSDERVSTSWHVVPPSWQFGQTFISKKNFRAK